MELTTTVNDEARVVEVDGAESAVDVVRDGLGLTGTKLVCGSGVCGACTMLVDGEPVLGCLTPATRLRDARVTTVEGLADGDDLHPVQRAFMHHDGLQCGYCTPGFVVDAVAFHDRWRADHGPDDPPDRVTIAEALAGHLCRCGSYEGIYRAVEAACRGEHDDGAGTVERVDAPAKVTGAARYTTDVVRPGLLHAAIRRADVAAGLVGPIAFPDDVVGIEVLPDDRRVRWAGQPIAVVAAESAAAARRLARELDVPVTPQPFVLDPEAASRPGAALVYATRADRKEAPTSSEGGAMPAPWDGNRHGPSRTPFLGTVAKRRIGSARSEGRRGLVELEFHTAVQLHTAFEPHACLADWSDPQYLRVWLSTQGVEAMRLEIADHFDLDPTQVEVVAEHVGGGFGAKLGLTMEAIAAISLSRLTRRPVRLVLDRHEELTGTGNRPGSRSRISMLVDDGSQAIRALTVDTDSHAGVAVGNSVAALSMLLYDRTPRLARDVDVVTNAPPGAPFRGPGGPTIAWALEQTVDETAHRFGRDPIELRAQWDGNPKRQALYRWASALPTWQDRPATGSQTGRFRRGVGVAAANWMYFVDPDCEVVVSVEAGRLVAATAVQDMGTGSRTVLARAVAGVFGVDPTAVDVRMGRAHSGTTHGPASGGSRTTVSLWSTAVEAATSLRARIGTDLTAAPDGMSATAKRGGDRGMRAVPFTMGGIQVGRGFSAALHVSEVEVDTRTGKTRVLRVHGGIAVGRIHAPVLARSQCEGSVIQGIGLALYENQVLDPHTGLTLTANLEDYRIPQLGDTPEIDIHFHEEGWDRVPGGGVGLGEVATISPAASVGNAIFNATGWRPLTLPVRPDRLLEGLAGFDGRADGGHAMSITILTAYDERPEGAGEFVYRAGGTDLQERLRTTGATPHVLDLTGVPGFAGIERTDSGTTIGAGTTVATLARDLAADYPALALTAAGLATPQVRATATLGGNLLQRTRCWYFRHPHTSCFKSGGDSCPARDGRHLYGNVFDTAPCVHPHPSSLAMALLAYAATVDTTQRDGLAVGDVLGDGSDPSRDHLLADDEVLTHVTLPPPAAGERAAYFRSISRFEAEWPLVEAVCRVVRDDAGVVTSCAVAIGGVAPTPLRLRAVEDLLTGSNLADDVVEAASAAAASGAKPLPETGYKVALVDATVREVLERVRS